MVSIYIHIPYCIHKCFYCDFYSIENLNSLDTFVDALCKEIELAYSVFYQTEITPGTSGNKSISLIENEKDFVVDSIFLGGGTPSLLRPMHLEKILTQIKNYFILQGDLEFTVECNPETVQLSVLKEYREMGVNRLSVGIQSFVESELRFLERTHNVHKAERAIINGRDAGFDNINIDLIFAIPGQTLQTWEYSLDKAICYNPDNISAYSLIYEPETPLYDALQNGKVIKVADKSHLEMYKSCIKKLTDAGYIQYEVSNFSHDGKRCRHNLNYWRGGHYLGFGPSAHGYINNKRYWNWRSLTRYFGELDEGKLPIQSTEIIGTDELLDEYIMLGLRSEGINIIYLKEKFNINLTEKMNGFIQSLINAGKMKRNGNILRLTAEGYIVSDEVIVQLLKNFMEQSYINNLT